jgi:hypothetical protein
MASTFRNLLVSGIGTVHSSPVLTTGGSVKTTVIGLSLTNMTTDIVLASIQLVDSGASTSAYYLKDVLIPPNQSLRVINGGEKLILGSNVDVYVFSNTTSALDLVMSFVEITG